MLFAKHLLTIPEQIAIQINDAILRGELRLGDRLPSENELSNLFGVSRSTIRDALNLLRTEHIVQTQKGKLGGHFVSKKASPRMVKHLRDYAFSPFKLRHLSFEHFFEIRSLIEVPVAGLASIHRSNEDLASLKALLLSLNDLNLSPSSSYLLLQADISFHRLLAQASRNPLVVEIFDVFIRLYEVLSLQFVLSQNQQRTVLESLHAIYRAVEEQDSVQAEQEMYNYLHLLRDFIRAKKPDINWGYLE